MYEVILERMVRRVVQKKIMNISEGSPNKISIVGVGLIDIHRRVVHTQYQSSETTQLIYIHRRVVHKQIKTKVLIRGLGRCEGVVEDSGYEMIS